MTDRDATTQEEMWPTAHSVALIGRDYYQNPTPNRVTSNE